MSDSEYLLKMATAQPKDHWGRLNLAVKSELSWKPPDLWIVSKEGFYLPTSTSLLILHSSLLNTILSSSNMSSSCIFLPIPALPISFLLTLLSEGAVSHNLTFNPHQVLEAAELLGIDIDIHVEANTGPPAIENESVQVIFTEDHKKEVKYELTEAIEDDSFLCKLCDYSTTTKTNLGEHKKTHLPENSMYKCRIDGCIFKAKTKNHMKTHNEAKHKGMRYNCHLCDYQTAYRKDLGRHLEGKHKSGASPFAWPCNICHFRGMDTTELQIHVNKRHKKHSKMIEANGEFERHVLLDE